LESGEPVAFRESFIVGAGWLGGWLAGSGVPVLLLHGGPGLSFSYLDDQTVGLALLGFSSVG
jgi:hypothetical protein